MTKLFSNVWQIIFVFVCIGTDFYNEYAVCSIVFKVYKIFHSVAEMLKFSKG